MPPRCGRYATWARWAVVQPLLAPAALLAVACSNVSTPGPTTTTPTCPTVAEDTQTTTDSTKTTPYCPPVATATGAPAEVPGGDWWGTFAGTVTWDCGPMGERTGRLSGEYTITTGTDGRPEMLGTNTVTGSCAGPDVGTLTTNISAQGNAIEGGFEFPGVLWGPPGTFVINVSGDRGRGVLEGSAPGPARVNLVFEISR